MRLVGVSVLTMLPTAFPCVPVTRNPSPVGMRFIVSEMSEYPDTMSVAVGCGRYFWLWFRRACVCVSKKFAFRV